MSAVQSIVIIDGVQFSTFNEHFDLRHIESMVGWTREILTTRTTEAFIVMVEDFDGVWREEQKPEAIEEEK